MRKKIWTLLMSGVMMGNLFLTACSPTGTESISTEEEDTVPETEQVSTEKQEELPEAGLVLYVDAAAEAGGDGSESAPFVTIEEAQMKIREIKAEGGLPEGGINVLVKAGEYDLKNGLVFTEEDSGTEECPVRYISEETGAAILSGGLRISATDFEPLNEEEKSRLSEQGIVDKIYKADLTKFGLTEADWGELYSSGFASMGGLYYEGSHPNEAEVFINGTRQVLARYPNEGYVYTKDVVRLGYSYAYFELPDFNQAGSEIPAPEGMTADNPIGGIFTMDEETHSRVKNWKTYDDVWIYGYMRFLWAESAVPVKAINTETGELELAQAVTYSITKKAPYYFYNVFEELDEEGEYYIDRDTGMLYIYAPENFDSAEITMSCTTSDLISGSGVSHVVLNGFSLCQTRGKGIVLNGDSLTIENCNVYNIRGGAMSLDGTDILVQNCEISHTGGYGIDIRGGDLETLTRSENLVYNNYIHHWAEVDKTHSHAIRMSGCGVTASHNEICYTADQAITWDGPYHTIEYNEIHDVCTDTGDSGAMYAGRNFRCYGTVIRYNCIYNVGRDGYVQGIYCDDGLSGQTIYGNIVVNTTGDGILIGGGRDNSVYNNLIIDAQGAALSYDNRMRDGQLNGGWYGPVFDTPQYVELREILENEVWMEAFPQLQGLEFTVTKENRDDAKLACNPANNYVTNNIGYSINIDCGSFAIKNDIINFSPDGVKFNRVLHTKSDIPGYAEGDYTLAEDAEIPSYITFDPIPFAEIGRVSD